MFVGGFIRESSNVTWFLSEYRVDSGSLQRKHGESSISPAITINWMNIRPTFAVAVAPKNSWIIEMFSRFLWIFVISDSKFQGTINQFHIHFVQYAGYGSNLKGRLERRVCGKSGWRSGGLPCHGKVRSQHWKPRLLLHGFFNSNWNHGIYYGWFI